MQTLKSRKKSQSSKLPSQESRGVRGDQNISKANKRKKIMRS
jgi:hypothetical protein